MSLAAVIGLLVVATLIFDAVLAWALIWRHKTPTEFDRQMEAADYVVYDLAEIHRETRAR